MVGSIRAAAYVVVLTLAGLGTAHAGVCGPIPVPEPGTLALLAVGAAGVFAVRRRRK